MGIGLFGPRPAPSGSAASTLAGDANGPLLANEVNSLTGTAGGANVPLEDMSDDPTQTVVVVRLPGAGYSTVVLSALLAGAGCIDGVINSQAELEALWPNVAGVHTVAADGVYCFGEFALTAGRSIAVPAGRRCRFIGHGSASVVTFNNAGGGITLAATSEFYADNLVIRQSNAAGSGILTSSAKAVLNKVGFDGDGVADGIESNNASSCTWLNQCWWIECVNGCAPGGGSFFIEEADFFDTDFAVDVVAESVTVHVNDARVRQASTVFVQSFNVTREWTMRNVVADTITTFFFRAGGTLAPYMDLSGNRVTNQLNQFFHPNGTVPVSMTSVYRNSVNTIGGGSPAFFAGGFTTGSANARVRANSFNNVLQAEV